MILPLYLPAFFLSVAQGLIVPVLPVFAQDLGGSYVWIGLILAGGGVGQLIGDLPAGLVMRRINQRSGMVIGIGLVSLTTLALFWASSLPVVFLLRVISGLGGSLYNISRHSYIAENITIATRGRSVALLGGTFRLGRMIGPVAAGMVAIRFGLRVPFLIFAIVCGLAVLTILLFNHHRLETAPAAKSEPVTLRSIARFYRSYARRLAFPGLGQYLLQMVRAGPGVVIPLYGAQVLGLDIQQIGWVLGAGAAIDATLFYPTGIIMDRWGRKRAIVPSTIIQAAGLILIPFTESVWALALASVLNGFGNGLGSGVMLTLGADLAPPENRGEFLGVWNLIGDAGITSGPVLVGGVADLLALQPAIFVIASTGLASALVFGLLVPETLKKKITPAAPA